MIINKVYHLKDLHIRNLQRAQRIQTGIQKIPKTS